MAASDKTSCLSQVISFLFDNTLQLILHVMSFGLVSVYPYSLPAQ